MKSMDIINKIKVLFIKCSNASFIELDNKILSEICFVKDYYIKLQKRTFFFLIILKQFFWLILNQYKYKIIYIWFSDYHSFLPVFFSRIFKNKIIIIAGGYDVDVLLNLKCSGFKERIRKFVCRYCFLNADLILAVSRHIRKILINSNVKLNVKLVYNCVNSEIFEYKHYKKEKIVITVGGGSVRKAALNKCLDFFIEIGNRFNYLYPDFKTQFLLIGHNKTSPTYFFLKDLIISPNIKILPVLPNERLLDYYKKASVYMQLSKRESFGVAQVEAMATGCIPISHNGGAIKEIVGNSGFVLDGYFADDYIKKLAEVLSGKHENLRNRAVKKTRSNFTVSVRKRKLIKIIENVT